MAAPGVGGQPARSLLAYYGPKSGIDGLKVQMPVTPEEVSNVRSISRIQNRQLKETFLRAARVLRGAGGGDHRPQLLPGVREPAVLHRGASI